MSAASNTEECMLELKGRKIVGVLTAAFPLVNRDLARSTHSFILDDGTAFTFNSNGSFWRETHDDVRHALKERMAELEKTKEAMTQIITNAGGLSAVF